MSHRIELEPVFLLHQWPFRNTSLIIDMLTLHHGRVAAVARSARGPKSQYRGMLQLFTPMLASWSGRADLKILGKVEFHAPPYRINQMELLCGFYVNELLVTLLHRDDPHPKIFSYYEELLLQLSQVKSWQAHLRYFEKKLLSELGYGLPLWYEMQTGEKILVDVNYEYVPNRGFFYCTQGNNKSFIFSGSTLLALHEEKLVTDLHLWEAKRLMRIVLSQYLGKKTIKSREIFI